MSSSVGFFKGNNKKVDQTLNEAVMARFAKMFEDDDDEEPEQQEPSNQKPTVTTSVIQKLVKPEIVKTVDKIEQKRVVEDTKDSHKLQKCVKNGYFMLNSRKNDQPTMKKIQKIDQTPMKVTDPPYERNNLLLIKIRKLDRWLIGAKMHNLKNEAVQQIAIMGSNQVIMRDIRIFNEFKHSERDQKVVRQYLKQNYPKMFVIKETRTQLKEWVYLQYFILVPKLLAFSKMFIHHEIFKSRIYNDYNLVREMEYRFFIQYILQERTIVQKILSQDESIKQHLALLVQNIEISTKQKRYYLKLSDGWYPFFLIIDMKQSNKIDSSDQFLGDLIERKKLQVGDKLHVMFLQINPILIDTKDIESVRDSGINTIICCGFANGIKKASYKQKLGKQEIPYFIRSVMSVKSYGGPIPCLDLMVIQKSYLTEGFGTNQKVVDIKYEQSSQDFNDDNKQPYISYSCILKCFDSLHYFNASPVKMIVYVTVRNIQPALYEVINPGDRIRVINSEPTSIFENQLKIVIKCQKNQGIIVNELQQYPRYVKQQMELLAKTLNSELLIQKYMRLDLVLYVTDFQEHGKIITGLTEGAYLVKLELHKQNFFSPSINKSRLCEEIVIVTEVQVKQVLSHYPPYIAYCQTTELSRFVVQNQHWMSVYQKSIEKLQVHRKSNQKK